MDLRAQNANYDEEDNQNEEYKEDSQEGTILKLLVKKEGEVSNKKLTRKTPYRLLKIYWVVDPFVIDSLKEYINFRKLFK